MSGETLHDRVHAAIFQYLVDHERRTPEGYVDLDINEVLIALAEVMAMLCDNLEPPQMRLTAINLANDYLRAALLARARGTALGLELANIRNMQLQ